VQFEQMGDIGGGIPSLRVGERPARPIGETVTLRKVGSEHFADERAQRRRRVTEKAARELGVEELTRDRPARLLEHLEVLVGGMRHRDAGAVENRGQGRQVDRERIHERDSTGPRDLQQGEHRVVRLFPVELGVEGVERLFAEFLDELV
jgi:hypothetical protein